MVYVKPYKRYKNNYRWTGIFLTADYPDDDCVMFGGSCPIHQPIGEHAVNLLGGKMQSNSKHGIRLEFDHRDKWICQLEIVDGICKPVYAEYNGKSSAVFQVDTMDFHVIDDRNRYLSITKEDKSIVVLFHLGVDSHKMSVNYTLEECLAEVK